MRSLEIVIAVIIALVLFVALKLLGSLLKFALIAAALGFVGGLVLARTLRGRGA